MSVSVSLSRTPFWHMRKPGIESCENVPGVHDLPIRFNFLYFHREVNTFATPEMCLYLDSDVWAGCFINFFLRDLFIILGRFLAGSCSVKMLQAFHDPSINFHCTWERYHIYSNKHRVFAALIRGRRLFKNCARQIYFFYIFIQCILSIC